MQIVSSYYCCPLQGSAKRLRPGLVNFIPAVAYPFCRSLPTGITFTKHGQSLLADTCRVDGTKRRNLDHLISNAEYVLV